MKDAGSEMRYGGALMASGLVSDSRRWDLEQLELDPVYQSIGRDNH